MFITRLDSPLLPSSPPATRIMSDYLATPYGADADADADFAAAQKTTPRKKDTKTKKGKRKRKTADSRGDQTADGLAKKQRKKDRPSAFGVAPEDEAAVVDKSTSIRDIGHNAVFTWKRSDSITGVVSDKETKQSSKGTFHIYTMADNDCKEDEIQVCDMLSQIPDLEEGTWYTMSGLMAGDRAKYATARNPNKVQLKTTNHTTANKFIPDPTEPSFFKETVFTPLEDIAGLTVGDSVNIFGSIIGVPDTASSYTKNGKSMPFFSLTISDTSTTAQITLWDTQFEPEKYVDHAVAVFRNCTVSDYKKETNGMSLNTRRLDVGKKNTDKYPEAKALRKKIEKMKE